MDWGSRRIRDALWTRLTAPHSIVALIVDDAWSLEHVVELIAALCEVVRTPAPIPVLAAVLRLYGAAPLDPILRCTGDGWMRLDARPAWFGADARAYHDVVRVATTARWEARLHRFVRDAHTLHPGDVCFAGTLPAYMHARRLRDPSSVSHWAPAPIKLFLRASAEDVPERARTTRILARRAFGAHSVRQCSVRCDSVPLRDDSAPLTPEVIREVLCDELDLLTVYERSTLPDALPRLERLPVVGLVTLSLKCLVDDVRIVLVDLPPAASEGAFARQVIGAFDFGHQAVAFVPRPLSSEPWQAVCAEDAEDALRHLTLAPRRGVFDTKRSFQRSCQFCLAWMRLGFSTA